MCVCVCVRVFNGCADCNTARYSRLPLPICISKAKANTLTHRRQCKTAKTPGELRLLELNLPRLSI